MKKNYSSIYLKSVTKLDVEFLFNLLKERDPRANISHNKMPTYDEHVNFVKSKPYSKWYIIFKSEQKVGSIYLTKNNEIGIFLSKKFQVKNIGKFGITVEKQGQDKIYDVETTSLNDQQMKLGDK